MELVYFVTNPDLLLWSDVPYIYSCCYRSMISKVMVYTAFKTHCTPRNFSFNFCHGTVKDLRSDHRGLVLRSEIPKLSRALEPQPGGKKCVSASLHRQWIDQWRSWPTWISCCLLWSAGRYPQYNAVAANLFCYTKSLSLWLRIAWLNIYYTTVHKCQLKSLYCDQSLLRATSPHI